MTYNIILASNLKIERKIEDKRKIKECYNLRLSLDCNLGKDLSKKIGISQLVKYKDTGLYLQLYISINNEVKY